MNMLSLTSGAMGRILCVLLSVSMATGPSATLFAQTNAAAEAVRQRAQGLGQAPPSESPPPDRERSVDREVPLPQEAPPTPIASNVDTSYVSSSAVAVLVIRPSQLMAAPLAQMFPVEVASAAGLQQFGFDPAEIEEAVAFVQMPSGETGQPDYGIAVKFLKPFKGSAIPANVRAHLGSGEIAGRKYLKSKDYYPSLFAPDSKTLVVAPDAILQQLIANKDQSKSGPAIDRVHAAPAGSDLYLAVDVAALRPIMAAGMLWFSQQIPPGAPPEVQQLFEAPNLISAAELTVNLAGSEPVSLVVHANDEAGAERLEQLADTAMKIAQAQMKAEMGQQAAGQDPVEQALGRYIERLSAQWADSIRPQREGSQLVFFKSKDGAQQPQFTHVALAGVAAAMLLPALQASRNAARRTASMNQMRQILLALHNYHDKIGTFPAHAIYSADGNPLLSWRVAILPFLGEDTLYKQFKLDEPWDSEHNRSLVTRMPAIYANPKLVSEPGKTNLLAVVGEPCAFNGTKDGLGLRNFTDGTSNTAIVVEADPDRAVEWTRPDDWQFDAANPTAGLGGTPPGNFQAGLADGSVRTLIKSMPAEMFVGLFTRAGGEVLNQRQPVATPAPRGRVPVPPR